MHKGEDEEAVEALLLATSGSEKNVDEKSVQVDSSSIPCRKLNFTQSLSTDNVVRAFTCIPSVTLFRVICDEVAQIDDNASEMSVVVLVSLKTCLSLECLGTLFGISKSTVHRLFYVHCATLLQF